MEIALWFFAILCGVYCMGWWFFIVFPAIIIFCLIIREPVNKWMYKKWGTNPDLQDIKNKADKLWRNGKL